MEFPENRYKNLISSQFFTEGLLNSDLIMLENIKNNKNIQEFYC